MPFPYCEGFTECTWREKKKNKQNTLGGLFSQLFHKLSAGGLEEAQGIHRQTKFRWGGSGESGKKVEKLLSYSKMLTGKKLKNKLLNAWL